MESSRYHESLWHAEHTIPAILMFLALPVLYLWLRPFLAATLAISFALLALGGGGSAWAKRREKFMVELEYAQPGSVRSGQLHSTRLAHVVLACLMVTSAVVFFIAIILVTLPGI